MQLLEYLNSIYDSDDLDDYKYGRIDTETPSLSESEKEILELIVDIIRLNIDYKEKDPVFTQSGCGCRRLPELKSITREDFSPLLSLDIETLPLPVRARIADFLWVTAKDQRSAHIAVGSYLELYEKTWDEDHWTDCVEAIYRAVNISCSLGRKGQQYKKSIKAVRDGLDRSKGNDRFFLSLSLLEILAEEKCGFDADIQTYSRNAIEAATKDHNFTKAQEVLEALAKLDPQNRKLYFEEAGDITQALAFGPAIRRVHILKQALQYYSKAGVKEKLKQCRRLLDEAQNHILDEMTVIKRDPIDISSTVNDVVAVIKNTNSFKQAIVSFGSLVHIYKRDELVKIVQDDVIGTSLFPPARVDAKGRQKYSLPVLSGEICMDNADVQLHMWDKARQKQEIYADISLKYAFAELNKLYQYSEEDLDFLVNDNAIIPEGREKIVRKGLFLGLQGDLYAALHILLPQMENIIRYLVEICGGKTYHYEKGNTKEDALSSILDEPELKEQYDPEILFCLMGLLDKPEGSNLRNEFAHGIMEPGNTLIELYFLGFMIRFLSWYSITCLEELHEMNKKENKGKEQNDEVLQNR